MNAELTFNGYLLLTAENITEEFALRKWYELHGNAQIITKFPSRPITTEDTSCYAMKTPPVEIGGLYVHQELGVVRVVGYFAQVNPDFPAMNIVRVEHDLPASAQMNVTANVVYHVRAEHLRPLPPNPVAEVPLFPK